MFDKPRLLGFLLSRCVGTPVLAQDLVGKMGSAELHAGELAQLERLVRSELVRKSPLTGAKEKGWDKRPGVAALMERAYLVALTRKTPVAINQIELNKLQTSIH